MLDCSIWAVSLAHGRGARNVNELVAGGAEHELDWSTGRGGARARLTGREGPIAVEVAACFDVVGDLHGDREEEEEKKRKEREIKRKKIK